MSVSMTSRSDYAREALLDAAEALFAVHGIDAVSDRAIAEKAGTANHSAVGYHFGGREGLLRALSKSRTAGKHSAALAMIDALPGPPTLRDILTAHTVPWVEDFAALPFPARRARLLVRIASTPSISDTVEGITSPLRLENLLDVLGTSVDGVPPPVLRDRARMLDAMMFHAFSSFEDHLEQGISDGSWASAGQFLIDAGVGLLEAPVTDPGIYLTE